MKITKDKDNLIVKIPLRQRMNNSYMNDEDLIEVPNLVGVIVKSKDDSGMMEQGIYNLNDLSYKGSTQLGMPIVMTCMEDANFRKLCKEVEIDIWEYEACVECNKPLWETHTCNDKGESICCEHEK